METRKIQKVGNSLAIAIPAKIARKLKIFRGDLIAFKLELNNQLTIYKVQIDIEESMKK